ncbi:hypothetical protein METUNv1_02858 [Methyloversatilis universalis FAM5]|uniref:ABC3 transporter permease C-terminal domain-containing protein n=1 Tax=Methyloversatilis universalis (strain ATCC BAA-1314 / DSM 25237 / JCM 13912 / CCUG 52030 / FAM5) TaxID=1000565 RepID=F5REY3_METUF|nr:FtsX-like permease family protein [Methyloversatilis universalis]EGK71464.1 hypothetical protein METUNv1_02858 [Methyloversatilis universalis FAM5]
MIPLARKTLFHEWRRFVPALFAVAFSCVLLVVQAALVEGIFGSAALYINASSADLWAGYPGTQSVNFGREIGPDVALHLGMDPAVSAVESYLWVEGDWYNAQRSGGGVSVFVSGISTAADALMFSRILTPYLRALLRSPDTVIVDRADLEQLGTGVGATAWLNGRRVRIAAAVTGLRALGGVNVLASQDTARLLQPGDAGTGSTYVVARLRDPEQAVAVRDRLAGAASFGPYELWTAQEFARRSQLYWLLDTGAGIAVLFMAVIVCIVGAIVTSQSLTAVVIASAREYATLNALGASLRALSRVVLEQSCWIGGLGLAIGGMTSAVLLFIAARNDVPVQLTLPVAGGCALAVLALALGSGLFAVRGLLRADPALLLR